MLRGEIIGLRAQQDSDIEVFEAELMNEVETRVRSDSRPWRPVAPGSADSPYRGPAARTTIARWSSSLPSSWLPANWWARRCCGASTCTTAARTSGSPCGRRSAGSTWAPISSACCAATASPIRGLHRLQVDTLADNDAMIGAATRAGFVLEGTLRQAAWVDGSFADEVILSRWRPNSR